VGNDGIPIRPVTDPFLGQKVLSFHPELNELGRAVIISGENLSKALSMLFGHASHKIFKKLGYI
jgi:hypothetical protein